MAGDNLKCWTAWHGSGIALVIILGPDRLQHAYESQRQAKIAADLWREGAALQTQAMCYVQLGEYQSALALCERATELGNLCGMANGELDDHTTTTKANVHMLKSEYAEALDINKKSIEAEDIEQVTYGFALLSIIEIELMIGAPRDDLQRNIEVARSKFKATGFVTYFDWCDAFQADLHLRDGDTLLAETMFQKCLSNTRGSQISIMTYCLERLGNGRDWDATNWTSSWTTVYLGHSLKIKQKLGIYKAFQFLGYVFEVEGDQDTARSLFIFALEGFAAMDIHRSEAECLFHLGDISQKEGDLVQAVAMWSAARPLFEKSSQTKQIVLVDDRLERNDLQDTVLSCPLNSNVE